MESLTDRINAYTVSGHADYVTAWEHGSDYAEHLNGEDWFTVGRRWSKLRKRLPHRHVAQTRGRFHGTYLERCPCGAYGPGPWFRRL